MTVIQVVFHPMALKEYQKSYKWYENKLDCLGERFISEIEKTLSFIVKQPTLFAYSISTYRIAHVPIFPYSIIYEYLEKEQLIYIYSIFHQKRNPLKKYRKRIYRVSLLHEK